MDSETAIIENRKGQQIIVSLLLFFVALVIVSTLLGPMLIFTDFAINQTNSSVHSDLIATLLNYIPLFVVLVLVTSLFLILANR